MLRKFVLVVCCFFVFGMVFVYTRQPNVELIPVMALPVSNKVIIVDAGHGTPDERSCLLTLKITLIFYKK